MVAVAAVVCVGMLVFSAAFRAREPEYGGKRLSEWVRGYAARDRTRCDAAVRQIGTNAVPFLLEWMQYETPAWKSNVYHIANPSIARMGGARRFNDNKLIDRAEGTMLAFVALGDKATNAIGDLAKLMNDPARGYISIRAAAVLTWLGKPGLVPVLSAVTNQQLSVQVRRFLIQQVHFAKWRSTSSGAAPDEERLAAVLQQLQLDPDPLIRSMASDPFQPDF